MTELEMQDTIGELLLAQEEDDAVEFTSVRTFEEAGVMTYNKGLVVKASDGSEFQVQIVQSAYPPDHTDTEEES